MAISLSNFFQSRKFSLILPLSVFFLCVLLFTFSSSFGSPLSYFSTTDSFLRQQEQSISSPPLPPPPFSSRSAPKLSSSVELTPELISPVAATSNFTSPVRSAPIFSPVPVVPNLTSPNLSWPPVLATPTSEPLDEDQDEEGSDRSQEFEDLANLKWGICKDFDYIPCLDNLKAIRKIRSRRHMEHRERHCPWPSPRCLAPLPPGYTTPIPWPRSRDMIWYCNVPHPKLVEYKKGQNWIVKNGDYLQFPGGGTQFKKGVSSYIGFIEKTMPDIRWGMNIRVILDVGCGVASFGGYLLDKNVLTMSLAPKDEHEAQIQFALERGIPAFLSVIGTQKLTFPDNAYDLIHCARCRVHWDADGGKPLIELNRILRPGGFFIWSATPVYRDDDRDRSVWNDMVSLTKAICWKVVIKTKDQSGVGIVIYQKPLSSDCYLQRQVQKPPVCKANRPSISWYTPLGRCLPQLDNDAKQWPVDWPERLNNVPVSLSGKMDAFNSDINLWSKIVSNVYLNQLGINWTRVRNVMDMDAAYGGFSAALIDKALWVMNVVPVHEPDTLQVVFDRGLIGTYHDWCESFNTYPRSYDLLHSNFLLTSLPERCGMIELLVEVDRILRPEGWLIVHDSKQLLLKASAILRSLHWTVKTYKGHYLVGQKGFWRPLRVHR